MAVTHANPVEVLQQVAGGYCLPRCLHVVAEIGVADALDGTPRSAADLADAVGAHPDALDRILRLLAAHGVFVVERGGFGHSPASRLLRDDHPQSMRSFARMFGLPVFWETFGALGHTVRTGMPATTEVFPDGFWAFLQTHPEAGRVFNAAMTGKAHGALAGVLANYDFSPFGVIGDIGGGSGHLLRAVLDTAAPEADGILFDLPDVIGQVSDLPTERITLQAGDFFADRLPRCDLFILMEVIHDWGDEESDLILRAVRDAAPNGARLLLIEQIIPADPGPNWSKMLDVHMLALLGGRQRSLEEYERLLGRAGFRFERDIDTRAGISIIEATAA